MLHADKTCVRKHWDWELSSQEDCGSSEGPERPIWTGSTGTERLRTPVCTCSDRWGPRCTAWQQMLKKKASICHFCCSWYCLFVLSAMGEVIKLMLLNVGVLLVALGCYLCIIEFCYIFWWIISWLHEEGSLSVWGTYEDVVLLVSNLTFNAILSREIFFILTILTYFHTGLSNWWLS